MVEILFSFFYTNSPNFLSMLDSMELMINFPNAYNSLENTAGAGGGEAAAAAGIYSGLFELEG